MPTSSSSIPSTCPAPRRSTARSTSCAISASTSALALLQICVCACAASGCKGTPVEPPDAAPSPQASAEPAPLANVPSVSSATGTGLAGLDGGPAPESLRSDRDVPADTPHETSRELG